MAYIQETIPSPCCLSAIMPNLTSPFGYSAISKRMYTNGYNRVVSVLHSPSLLSRSGIGDEGFIS